MLIISMGCSFCAAVEFLTWYRWVKQLIIKMGSLLPSHWCSTLLDALNGPRRLVKASLVLLELTCLSYACESIYRHSETNQSPPRLHQTIRFIVASLIVFDVFSWLKGFIYFLEEINNTSTVTCQMRQESLSLAIMPREHKFLLNFKKMYGWIGKKKVWGVGMECVQEWLCPTSTSHMHIHIPHVVYLHASSQNQSECFCHAACRCTASMTCIQNTTCIQWNL